MINTITLHYLLMVLSCFYNMYSALSLANYFVEAHMKAGHPFMAPMYLQKLVYLGYGWSYPILNREIFYEGIQAWRFGPVLPSVYYAFQYQGYEIKEKVNVVCCNYEELCQGLDEAAIEVLEEVYKQYGNLDSRSREVVVLTEDKGTPWYAVYKGRDGVEIPKYMIQSYFVGLCKYKKKMEKKKKQENRKTQPVLPVSHTENYEEEYDERILWLEPLAWPYLGIKKLFKLF